MIRLEESRISGGDGMEPPVKALSELRDEFPFQDARQQVSDFANITIRLSALTPGCTSASSIALGVSALGL